MVKAHLDVSTRQSRDRDEGQLLVPRLLQEWCQLLNALVVPMQIDEP